MKTSNAHRLDNPNLQLLPKRSPKMVRGKLRTSASVIQIRKDIRQDAAFIRAAGKFTLAASLVGMFILALITGYAKDIAATVLAGAPLTEIFVWVPLMGSILTVAYGGFCISLAIALFAIADSLTRSANKLLTEA